MAEKVAEYFVEPHMILEFTEAGKKHFLGFTACFSSEQTVLRDSDSRSSEAPRKGLAPWHLAIMSAGQLIMELAFGEAGRAGLARSRLCLHGLSLCRFGHDSNRDF